MSSNNASVICIIFHFYVFGRNLPSHVCTPPCTRAVQHPEPLAARKIQRINSGKHAELHPTPFQPPVPVNAAAGWKRFPQQNLPCAQGLQDADLEAKVAFFSEEFLLPSIASHAAAQSPPSVHAGTSSPRRHQHPLSKHLTPLGKRAPPGFPE